MTRIVLLSDIHLSPTHGFFWENWRLARDAANAADARAVIINGDLAINGPDSDEEMEFAAAALKRIGGTVLPLPGNHDVGDEPPGQDAHQLVNEARLARWDRAIGADRFVLDIDHWRLIGLNSLLLGSGLPREIEQNLWLDEQLASAGDKAIALFLHKPLFLEEAGEAEPSIACVVPSARPAVLERLNQAKVQLVVSGHLHQHRDRVIDGIRHLWAPAIAFAASHMYGGDPACGWLVLDFTEGRVEVALERPEGLVSHDLNAIKQHGRYPFLRGMPPCPPPVEIAAT